MKRRKADDVSEGPSTKCARTSQSSDSRNLTPESLPEFDILYPDPKNPKESIKSGHLPVQKVVGVVEKHVWGVLGEFDQDYVVLPNEVWSAMKPYKSFLTNGVKFCRGECFFARADDHARIPENGNQSYLGRILEVRALDACRVYALIEWLYWPEELPASTRYPGEKNPRRGRRPWHGYHEVIASNALDVVNATSIDDHAEVYHWDEETDAEPPTKSDLIYWRQTFDHRTCKLSRLREMCVCNNPRNPDNFMIKCDNKNCGSLFHQHCLVEPTLARIYQEKIACHKRGSKASTGVTTGLRCATKPWAKALVGNIREEEPLMIEITDIRQGVGDGKEKVSLEDVMCPKCNEKIQ
ncbi:hypothetical protein BJ875DRAFT_372068 [Amylocarpus encephaloides]|uniref:BAH domain-containing protein n=1 Tax=Amylocarpus encephaloides TaxID=45428 RepID=A0A9P7YMG3_9HELO|nr:hypothetical protein BJ875DRAFT_372068 [Amylocarpus encephaloides]